MIIDLTLFPLVGWKGRERPLSRPAGFLFRIPSSLPPPCIGNFWGLWRRRTEIRYDPDIILHLIHFIPYPTTPAPLSTTQAQVTYADSWKKHVHTTRLKFQSQFLFLYSIRKEVSIYNSWVNILLGTYVMYILSMLLGIRSGTLYFRDSL
jgi:hypothetical protein